jgi:hypothetical protein
MDYPFEKLGRMNRFRKKLEFVALATGNAK